MQKSRSENVRSAKTRFRIRSGRQKRCIFRRRTLRTFAPRAREMPENARFCPVTTAKCENEPTAVWATSLRLRREHLARHLVLEWFAAQEAQGFLDRQTAHVEATLAH